MISSQGSTVSNIVSTPKAEPSSKVRTSLRKRVLLSWSSGKDCAWALHRLRQMADVEVVGLLTTFNGEVNRVAMHGVRHDLVEAQAAAAGLPLWSVPLPFPCSNVAYEACMQGVFERALGENVTHIAYGDLFLENIREYRVRTMTGTGLEPLFPIWCSSEQTLALSRTLVEAGVRAILTCVDTKQLAVEFSGREYNAQLLAEFPAGVDPCGENGEFHTFCFAGPMFDREISVVVGDRVSRDGFVFSDLLLNS